MADLVYPPVIGAARAWFKALDLRFDIEGTAHVPRRGGALLVSNHIGYLDFVFAGLAARPAKRLVRFMAKESVFRHRISGPLMRAMKHIPVDRGDGGDAYARALTALRSGEVVGVFPEATISRSFTLKDFRSGAARLAQEAGVPLVPMALWGSVRRGGAGHGSPEEAEHGSPEEAAAPLTARLRERIQELLESAQRAYPAAPANAADSWWLPAHLGGSAPTPAEAAAL